MSPEDFAARVRNTITDVGHDPEACHCELDLLMEQVLIELGYGDGVEAMQKAKRWYA